MGKTYLITGGFGLLGLRIIECLVTDNIDNVTKIVTLDLKFDSKIKEKIVKSCNQANISCDVRIGDVTTYDTVLSACAGCDVIIHTAGVIDFDGYTPDSLLYKVNLEGSKTVLKAAIANCVPYFLYTSSIEAVCPNENCDSFINGDEETVYPGKLIRTYGITKQKAEQIILAANGHVLSNSNVFTSVALRMPGVYGENEPMLDKLLSTYKSKSNKTIPSLSSAKITRMYIGNAAWDHILASKVIQEKPKIVGGKAYFLRDDTPDDSYMKINFPFLRHEGFCLHKRDPILPKSVLMLILKLISFGVWVLSMIGITIKPLITPVMLQIACCSCTVRNDLFKSHFKKGPCKFSYDTSLYRMREFVTSYLTLK